MFKSNIQNGSSANALKPKTSKNPIVIDIDDDDNTMSEKVDWRSALGVTDIPTFSNNENNAKPQQDNNLEKIVE